MSHKCGNCIHEEVCELKDRIAFFKELHERVDADKDGFPIFWSHVACRYYKHVEEYEPTESYLEHLVAEYERNQEERDSF
jgi:hypothetical protein